MRNQLLVIHLLFFSFLFIMSCNKDPVTPEVVNVSGQVGFEFGFLHDAKVEAGGKVVTTDAMGKFTIPDVSVPYDIKVMTSNGLDVMICKELSVSNPFINFEPGYIQTTSKIGAQFIAILDSAPGSTQRAFSVFVPDDGQPEAVSYYFGGAAQSEVRTDFYWFGAGSIRGKLIILVYSMLANRIYTFDKYYEKDGLNINGNASDTIVFNNPSSLVSTGRVNGTIENHYNHPSLVSMKLKFKNSKVKNFLDEIPGAFTFNFAVPTGILEPFTVDIEVRENHLYGKSRLQPETYNNVIKLYQAVDLVSPANNDSATLYNTMYTWDSKEQFFKVYELELKCIGGPFRRIRLIGPSLSAMIPDLSNMGYIHFGGGITYAWRVKKHFGLNNTDEFLRGNFMEHPAYQGYSGTDARYINMQ